MNEIYWILQTPTNWKRYLELALLLPERLLLLPLTLGGFYSEKQPNEIENFPLRHFPTFQINPNDIQPYTSTNSLNQLKCHPYFNFYKARAIIDYRRIKGAIKSIDELQQLKEFSQQDIERLNPISSSNKPSFSLYSKVFQPSSQSSSQHITVPFAL